jgi:hypothetical protein
MNKHIEEILDDYIGCQTNCVGNHEVSDEELELLVITVADICREIVINGDTTITKYFGLIDQEVTKPIPPSSTIRKEYVEPNV